MSWRNRSRTQKYKRNSGKPVFYGRSYRYSNIYKTQISILRGTLKCLLEIYQNMKEQKYEVAEALAKQKIYELETYLNAIERKNEKSEKKEERKNERNE